ncbi:MAG: hypothetical protein CM15mP117_15420 [Alphaproteobacteria bacterium]|nr:MAG: hypothetical protein CM15mP117_15420 [Alphaproteobacteria bacterium]
MTVIIFSLELGRHSVQGYADDEEKQTKVLKAFLKKPSWILNF